MARGGSSAPPGVRAAARIHPLDRVLSNQIAAGEVIDRPASVIKELLENSLDAMARRIEVEIAAGGVGLVRVRDDGAGIHGDDLELALSRHATSKIARLEDLERVSSYGFRGEALPSIASVSRFSLTSRNRGSDCAFQVVADGGAGIRVTPAALSDGTVASVRDLFFNTPARRKYLRTERTETRHAEEAVKRAALSRFDVAFRLLSNGRSVFRLPPAGDEPSRHERIARLLGQAFADGAVVVDFEGPGMTLRGWVGAPHLARAHPDIQYLFINARPVRDPTARHAVRQAFGHRLIAGRHPAYVLYLEVDPSHVDVNVHPAKHEVRFRQARLVHDFIWRSLSRAFDGALSLPAGAGAADAPPGPAGDAAAVAETDAGPGDRFGHARPRAVTDGDASTGPVALLAGRYSVRVEGETLRIVDLAKVRAMAIRAELERATAEAPAPSRPLLLPESLKIGEAPADVVESQLAALGACGFELRRSAPDVVTLRAVPACLAHVPVAALLDTLLAWAGRTGGGPGLPLDALAKAGGDHLSDLHSDPNSLASLLRSLESRPGARHDSGVMMELDAAAVASLLRERAR